MGYSETKEWQNTDDETGNVTSSGWSTTETTAGGTVTTDVFFSHGFDGEVNGVIRDTETKDESGETTEESRTVWNEDGSGSQTVKNADGTTTITKFDEDGKAISTQHFDAQGNEVDPPEEDKGEFWDVDIIYGDHSEPFQSSDMAADMKMLMEMDPSLEMYVDHFDFIM